jgi:hypothetical protein
MKIRIPAQTIEVDAEKWAFEYGVIPGRRHKSGSYNLERVREDVKMYFASRCQETVDDLGLGVEKETDDEPSQK